MAVRPGLYPKKSSKSKVYYVKKLRYAFSMTKIGADGKPIFATNQTTGLPLTSPTGEPIPVTELVEFKEWRNRWCEDGYVCVYEVTPDTDPRIAKELENDAANRLCEIMSEADYIKTTNPDLYEQLNREEETKKTIASKDSKITSLEEEIAKLRAKTQGR